MGSWQQRKLGACLTFLKLSGQVACAAVYGTADCMHAQETESMENGPADDACTERMPHDVTCML